uniref:TSA: Wollemia nobilis Ref_Wollemi_Transcript_21846_1731 transcribed RNA sequence n=1 Tax=Wollemia nobilis TaxID=56998 RepID=A0A0C9S244_9CONI
MSGLASQHTHNLSPSFALSTSRLSKINSPPPPPASPRSMMPGAVEVAKAVRQDRKSTLFPARASQPRQPKLSWSDLQMLCCNYIQKGLVYSMAEGSFDFRSVAELLKKSLSEALVDFCPLAGRLATSADGVVYIDCNDRGVDFVEASAPDVGVADIVTDNVSPVVRELFALDGAININGHFLPLLTIQVTKLRDGIVVGFTVNHAVVDGTALWQFINCWAQLCRESSSAAFAHPPLHTRCFTSPSPIKLNLQTPKTPSLDKFSPPPFSEKVFHFTGETISRLKERATRASKDGLRISSFQALSAHIWQAITRARDLPPTELTTFKLAVNCRPRIVPPLPYSYFGNAIQFVSATITAEELLSSDMSHAAGILNRIISAHQDENIRAQLEQTPTVTQLDKSSPKNTVMMGSSPRFPMYDNDFGWGRPVGVRSGWANKFDGKMSAYPGPDGSGNVDIEICLLPQTMRSLESDPLFHFSCCD